MNRNEVRERAPGTPAARTGHGVRTKTYDCRIKALATMVDEETVANADTPIRPFLNTTASLVNQAMIEREDFVVNTLFKSGQWGTDAGTKDWATGNPITDIRTGIRTVLAATGRKPNRLWIGREAYDKVVDNPNLLARITGGSTPERPAFWKQMALAAELGLDSIHVSDAVETTSNKGVSEANSTSALILGSSALLYYAPDSAGIDSYTAASFFHFVGLPGTPDDGGIGVQTIPVPIDHGTLIEVQTAYDCRIVEPKLGYYFPTV